MSSMHVVSSHTTIAPEPSMDPASASALKSSRTSTMDAGKYPEEGPDGANAFSARPPRIPPAQSNISDRIGVPIGTSYTPGRATCQLTPTDFSQREGAAPAALYHSTPRARICGTFTNVSTLLIPVGF